MQSKEIDLTEAGDYTRDLIAEAGNILRERFETIGQYRFREGAEEEAIAADEETDKFLRNKIKKRYPESQFLTEETPPSEYGKVRQANLLWIIDSLDGRINFSRGHQNFTISIALAQNSEIRLGVVHFSLDGDTYWAEEGVEGAFKNGEPIEVSKIRHMKDALIAIDWPYNLRQREEVLRWANSFATRIRQVKSTGSAVADLSLIAEGRIDGYVQLGTKPWDTAAGGLLIKKAGGIVTTPENGVWTPFNDRVLASNQVLHDPIYRLING